METLCSARPPLITLSMASTPDTSNVAADPDNRWLWRMPSRRMEAELVRDGILFVAGKLDLTPGGPDIDYTLGLTVNRRSLYFRHAKEKRATFLRLFDSPSVVACYRRSESVVPQQALALANSTLVRDQSKALAGKLGGGVADSAFIASAFERLFNRPPTGAERDECLRYLDENSKRASGRASLVHVLFNHNDFVTVR